jgi:hypothetical protein
MKEDTVGTVQALTFIFGALGIAILCVYGVAV